MIPLVYFRAKIRLQQDFGMLCHAELREDDLVLNGFMWLKDCYNVLDSWLLNDRTRNRLNALYHEATVCHLSRLYIGPAGIVLLLGR